MKKKEKPFLELLKYMEKTGRLPKSGLCACVPKGKHNVFNKIKPTNDDRYELRQNSFSDAWWGFGHSKYIRRNGKWELSVLYIDNHDYKATNLRKTLVALCVVLNKEV